MFLRKKKINGQVYAYLVKNKWTEKGSRQKAKYIGKVLSIQQKENFISFQEYIEEDFSKYAHSHKKGEIIGALARYEFIKRGFELKKITVDATETKALTDGTYYYKDRRIAKISNNKEVILESNEGFLCKYSLDKLMRTKIDGYDEREKGIKLAKALLEAGLEVDHDLFVVLFERWMRND